MAERNGESKKRPRPEGWANSLGLVSKPRLDEIKNSFSLLKSLSKLEGDGQEVNTDTSFGRPPLEIDEDGFTKVPPKKRQKRDKTPIDLSELPSTNPVFQKIYENRKAAIQLTNLSRFLENKTRNSTLHVKDLQQLVQWVFDLDTAPKWAFLQNKALIEKVIVISVDGLDESLFLNQRDKFEAFKVFCPETKGMPLPLTSPGSRYRLYPISTTFLQVELPVSTQKKKKKERKPTDAKNTIYDFIVTQDLYDILSYPRKGLGATSRRRTVRPTPDAEIVSEEAALQTLIPIKEDQPEENGPEDPEAELVADIAPAVTETEEGASNMEDVTPNFVFVPVEEDGPFKELQRDRFGFIQLSQTRLEPHIELIAIDCEMVMTSGGSELCRVSIIDANRNVMYDTLVKPHLPVTDYLERWSGVNQEMLDPVTTTLEDVQLFFKRNFSAETVILGHSLENDFNALKIYPEKVIDTVVLYPHSRGLPSRNALRNLTEKFLNRSIQTSRLGHSSVEDSIACLDLLNMKLENGPNFGLPTLTPSEGNSLFSYLRFKRNIESTLIDRQSFGKQFEGDAKVVKSNSDDETIAAIETEISSGSARLVWAQLREISTYFQRNYESSSSSSSSSSSLSGADLPGTTLEAVCSRLNAQLMKIYALLKPNTMLMIMQGQYNGWRYRTLMDRKNLGGDWSYNDELALTEAIDSARKGVCSITVK